MNKPTNGKESAAIYVLSRMVADPRLAWLIGPGSTAYDRLTAEAAASRGQTQEEFCAVHEPLLKFEPWPRPADVADGVKEGVQPEGDVVVTWAGDQIDLLEHMRALRLLIAAGHVTQEKVDEAFRIAAKLKWPAGVPAVDRSEDGRNKSAVLGNNIQAFVDAGLSFPQALDTALKVYDHPSADGGKEIDGGRDSNPRQPACAEALPTEAPYSSDRDTCFGTELPTVAPIVDGAAGVKEGVPCKS
jgi:hypothetical protein